MTDHLWTHNMEVQTKNACVAGKTKKNACVRKNAQSWSRRTFVFTNLDVEFGNVGENSTSIAKKARSLGCDLELLRHRWVFFLGRILHLPFVVGASIRLPRTCCLEPAVVVAVVNRGDDLLKRRGRHSILHWPKCGSFLGWRIVKNTVT